jgi:hypothetical protein
MSRSQKAAFIISKFSKEVQQFFRESFRFQIKAGISLDSFSMNRELERAWAIWQDHPHQCYADYYNLLEQLNSSLF